MEVIFRNQVDRELHNLLVRAAIEPGDAALISWKSWFERVNIEGENLDTLTFRLLPIVYRNLSGFNLEHAFLPKLRGIYRRCWLENQLSLQKITPLIQQISEEGFNVLVMDDLNSILRLYEGKGVRKIFTLDLLIHLDDINRLLDFLKSQNIWPKVRFGERYLKVETPLEIWSPVEYPLTLSWRAMPSNKSKEQAIQIWQQADQVNLGDCQVYTLDLETHFLRMCLRSMNARKDAAFFSMVDVAWMLAKQEKNINWERVIDLGSKNNQLLPLMMCLQKVSEILEIPKNDDLLNKLSKFHVSWVDRLENRWINNSDTFPNRVDRFMRRLLLFRRSPKIPGLLGFLRYFQYAWGGSSLISLPKLFFRHMFKQ